jgi:hypothetical protein
MAVDSSGSVYTWGDNSFGQLGDGTTTNSSTPVCISDIETSPLKGKVITAVAAGSRHSMAVDSNGKVYAWGYNYYGQLGDGTTTKRSSPVCIQNLILDFSLKVIDIQSLPNEIARTEHYIKDIDISYVQYTIRFNSDAFELNTNDINADGVFDSIEPGDFKVLSHTPITEDPSNPKYKFITIAAQYDEFGAFSTNYNSKICNINFYVKKNGTYR